MAKPDLDEMIENARGRIPPKSKPFEWWELPKDDNKNNFDSEVEAEEENKIKYIPGERPVEKGGSYEE